MTRPIRPDWSPPSDLRCLGGPYDGKWASHPPADYVRVERRGGAVWLYAPTNAPDLPRSALPGEFV